MYGHFVFFACKYTLFCSSLPNGFYLIFSFLYYKVEKYEGICNYFVADTFILFKLMVEKLWLFPLSFSRD